jgi:hypothetical protein
VKSLSFELGRRVVLRWGGEDLIALLAERLGLVDGQAGDAYLPVASRAP